MVDRIGQQLGNYRLIRRLGRGGFADVYLGEHLYLKSQAAIKLLHAHLVQDDLDIFITEAQTLVQLIHPHIVRVLDFGVEQDTAFLVMDHARNGTLRQRHAKGEQLPLSTIIPYIKQAAEALQYAHQRRLIHRDVKPENMLLGEHFEILLSDFGIATMVQSTLHPGTQNMAGTITYMAPEQVQVHPRPASDQYSLAVVVYEWLCGEPPFQGSFIEIATKHCLTPPPPLRTKRPDISPLVEKLVLTALSKEPGQRFASVQAFATALEQAAQTSTSNSFPATFSTAPLASSEQAENLSPLPATFSTAPLASSEQAENLSPLVAPLPLVAPRLEAPPFVPELDVPTQITPRAQGEQRVAERNEYNTDAPIPFMPSKPRMRRRTVVLSIGAIALILLASAGVLLWPLVFHRAGPNRGPTATTAKHTSTASITAKTVTSLADTGSGSLRQILDTANPGDTIVFAPAMNGTILLTVDDLIIAKNVTINGPGADKLSISFSTSGFHITVPFDSTVTINGLSFKGSNLITSSAIVNRGTLTLNNVVIADNKSERATGAIENDPGGKLTINNSIIAGNTSISVYGGSGGITNDGSLTINGSTVSGNSTTFGGGGIVITPPLERRGLLGTFTLRVLSHTVEAFPFSRVGRYSLTHSSEWHT